MRDVIGVTLFRALEYMRPPHPVPHLFVEVVDVMAEADSNRLTHPAAILIATNLSELHRLMPFAIDMACETGAHLQLLHILPRSAEFAADATGMPYYDREGAFSCASNMLDPWREHARKLGLQCTVVVREGSPVVPEIIAAVRQFRPDRLLLGTRSRSRIGKLFLGSVADHVLRSVNLPVFTVGPEAHLATEQVNHPRTVLFATTLGESHQANAALACQLAVSQKAKLILLNVLPAIDEELQPACPNILRSTISYELQQLAHRIGDNSCAEVDIRVVRGSPAIEILALAEASHASLIVMGAADHSLFDSITRDHTVARVLAHAQCPVLSLHGAVAVQALHGHEALATHT
jgi:nucleotide-binding universal stress UspA family protein